MNYRFIKNHPPFMKHLKRHLKDSKTAGSVFTAQEFKTARQIIDYAYKQIEFKYRGEIMVRTIDFGKVVGLEALIAIKDIPDHLRHIKREMRVKKEQGKRAASYSVLVAYGLKRTETSKITIIAEPIYGNPKLHSFSSIYPGEYAPDFDDKEFWMNHAFIAKK